MGAWGFKTFDNDDAADWVFAFEEEGAGLVAATLTAALDETDDHLDASVCCEALAAAEMVAAAKTGDMTHLSEEAAAALKGKADGLASPENIELAREAVTRIKTDSELRDLWEEAEEFADWTGDVEGLAARLG